MNKLVKPFTSTVIILFVALLASSSRIEAAGFADELRAALKLHDDSSTFDEQNAALHAFRDVTERYPDEWRGHFWAAYEETQISRLVRMNRGQGEGPISGYLDRSVEHLDHVKSLAPALSARDRSSIATLLSLIYQFRIPDEEGDDAEDWMAQAQDYLAEAMRLDPANPVVQVFIGTSLVRNGGEEVSIVTLAAAITVMEVAEEAMAKVTDRAMTTNYNSEWLPFWLPRTRGQLKALIGE